MLNFVLLGLGFLVLSVTTTSLNEPFRCPDISQHINFNISNVLGQWNIHEIISSTNYDPDEPLNCIEDTFSCTNCTTDFNLPLELQVDIYGIKANSGIVYRNTARILANNTDKPHTWILDFGTTTIRSELLYGSDQDYNVLLECTNNENGFLEFYKALLMSRSKDTLSESVVSDIKSKLEDYGIDTTNCQKVLHDEFSCTPIPNPNTPF